MVSFSWKSEAYKISSSKQIFGIWAWAVGTGRQHLSMIMLSNIPTMMPKCYTKWLFDFQKIHFGILPVCYFRLMLNILEKTDYFFGIVEQNGFFDCLRMSRQTVHLVNTMIWWVLFCLQRRIVDRLLWFLPPHGDVPRVLLCTDIMSFFKKKTEHFFSFISKKYKSSRGSAHSSRARVQKSCSALPDHCLPY